MFKIILFVVLLLGIQLFFLVNLQFTAWPEMFSYPYLRNHGFLLYKDMIHPYTPLLTLFLSQVYKVFGYDIAVLKAVAWVIILSSSLAVYLAARYLTKSSKVALLSLFVYVVLQPFFEGDMLWFDIAIVPLVLLSLLFLLKWSESRSKLDVIVSGFFIGLAVFTKQTSGLFLILSLIFLLYRKAKVKHELYFFYPSLIMGLLLLVRLVQENALQDFLNWTLLYPLLFWSKFPGYVQMDLSAKEWVTLSVLFIPTIFLTLKRQVIKDSKLLLLLLFLAGSTASVYPRFSFFHFQSALSILVITSFYLVKDWKRGKILLGMLGILVILGVLVHRPIVLRTWGKETRFYGRGDFKASQIVKDFSKENEKVFLLGLPSQYYVMAGRIPPKRWTDNFGWYLEIPDVQGEILSRWENDPPEVVFRRIPSDGNWFDLGTYQPKKIVDYIDQNYIFVQGFKDNEFELWVKKGNQRQGI